MSIGVECIGGILLLFYIREVLRCLNKIHPLLLDSPVIAAVKDDGGLRLALASDCRVIFLLYGSIVNIEELVQQIH